MAATTPTPRVFLALLLAGPSPDPDTIAAWESAGVTLLNVYGNVGMARIQFAGDDVPEMLPGLRILEEETQFSKSGE